MGQEDLQAVAGAAVQQDPGRRVRLHLGIAPQPTGATEVLPVEGVTQYPRPQRSRFTVRAGNITELHQIAIDPITTTLRSKPSVHVFELRT
jgi:hypothetical protein